MKRENEVDSYMIRYKPDLTWLAGRNLLENLRDFTGRVEFFNSEEEFISGLNYVNGKSELKEKYASGRITDCEIFYEIHWTVTCAEGGDCGQGETIIIYEYQICDIPGPSDGGSPTGTDENIDSGPSGNGGLTTGGGDPSLNDKDPSKCPDGEFKDENGNCIINNLNDPCLSEVADLTLNANLEDEFTSIIQDAFNTSDDVNLIIRDDRDYSDDRVLGETEIDRNWGVIDIHVYLNPDRLSTASREFIAATIYHEAFHALFLYLDTNKNYQSTPLDHHVNLFNNYLHTLKNSMSSAFASLNERDALGLILKGMLALQNQFNDLYTEILNKNNFDENSLRELSEKYEKLNLGTSCK